MSPPERIVDAHHRAVRCAALEEPPLGREITPEPAMPVEMIRTEIEEHRDVGGERAGELDLVGGKLENQDLAVPRRI